MAMAAQFALNKAAACLSVSQPVNQSVCQSVS